MENYKWTKQEESAVIGILQLSTLPMNPIQIENKFIDKLNAKAACLKMVRVMVERKMKEIE